MVLNRNTYFETVLKQAGFDDLVAKKINEYREYHEQKVKSVVKFYDFLRMYNATLDVKQGSELKSLNVIEIYNVLYEYSDLIEKFMIKSIDCIINRYKDRMIKLYWFYHNNIFMFMQMEIVHHNRMHEFCTDSSVLFWNKHTEENNLLIFDSCSSYNMQLVYWCQ